MTVENEPTVNLRLQSSIFSTTLNGTNTMRIKSYSDGELQYDSSLCGLTGLVHNQFCPRCRVLMLLKGFTIVKRSMDFSAKVS